MMHMYSRSYQGFIALVAMLMLALGTFAFSISTIAAAVSYQEMVFAREMRMQKQLDIQGCLESFELIKAKDYFLNRESDCGAI